jgi:nucleotide-binding universal stress UspA family protein
MNQNMKILIAYDGSECANNALDDLRRAGLPTEAEAHVVAVAEAWHPGMEIDEEELEEEGEVPVTRLRAHSRMATYEARKFALIAARRIQGHFPNWRISTLVQSDSPAYGLLSAADEIGPDLIVVGSHGRSVLGRLILGSVSQKVLAEASCSVRIARRRAAIEGVPLRIIVGVDGTPDSIAAVEQVASRRWPEGSAVQVIAAYGPVDVPIPFGFPMVGTMQQAMGMQWEMLENSTADAVARLQAAGLAATATVKDGAPIPVLLKSTREWGADCIFLGARGHRFLERFLLGSVSAAVAARADCSVEVVRSRGN